jgi:L-fucose isomerase-like protein
MPDRANRPDDSKPIGMLVLGRKRPGFDQEWNRTVLTRVGTALNEMGLTTVGAEQPVVDDRTTIAALDRVRAADADTLLVLQPSLGNGQLAFTVMQNWPKPVVLWATPERQDTSVVSSCSLVAQHLWASLFRQSRRPFEFVYGDPADDAVRGSLTQALRIAQVPAALARTKVGLVGSTAPGFVAMHADPFLLQQALGVQLHSLSMPMFIERVRGIDRTRVSNDIERVKELGLGMDGMSVGDLGTNSRYYLALRDLIEEEKLDAVALQCWPELGNLLGEWPYLALTRLTSEGFPTAMEGDVDGALTCHVGRLLDAGVGFITDWLEHDEQTIQLWHPGVAPLPLCHPAGAPAGPSLAKHFNIAVPMVVDGALRSDLPVTLARLWRCDGRYHLTAVEGCTIEPRRQLTGNSALVRVEGLDVRRWFDDALHAGLPHHVVLFGGHHRDALRRVARLGGVTWYTPAN